MVFQCAIENIGKKMWQEELNLLTKCAAMHRVEVEVAFVDGNHPECSPLPALNDRIAKGLTRCNKLGRREDDDRRGRRSLQAEHPRDNRFLQHCRAGR